MVHHFVNLIGWEKILHSSVVDRSCFHADSISFCIAMRVLARTRIVRNPGSSNIALINEVGKKTLILASRSYSVDGAAYPKVYAVPEQLVDVREYAYSLSSSLPNYERVILGISSPKQNVLATILDEIEPRNEYYCLGAVVDDYFQNRRIPKLIQFSGIEWLYRMFTDLERSRIKIFGVLKEVWQLATNPQQRLLMKRFSACFCRQE